MKQTRQKMMFDYFARKPPTIFWPGDIPRLLRDVQIKCHDLGLSGEQLLQFLHDEKLLVKAEFRSSNYPTIVRYLSGSHSPFQLATSLRRRSFLCHRTALVVHGLAHSSEPIYVNQEQSPKPTPEDITQESITKAFSNQQRQSQYIFKYAGTQYLLLSGKNTGRAGVRPLKGSDGGDLDVTDLERTFIDIVVRPAYAGGINQVADAYQQAVARIDIDHLIKLLKKMDYVYPYHQSIGFLLERAGAAENECRRLTQLGTQFDFYLDYKIKNPAYSKKWRLYYPPLLH
jgi:hypothetical protein